jgi:secondary thiamine-phosphate synthase enzyme
MLTKIDLQTPAGESLTDITAQVEEAVRSSGIVEGMCAVFVPHTTAGLAVNSAMDQNTLLDLREELHRLVPTRADFHHIYDTPADAAGHIKSVLVGASLTLIVSQSRPLLGSSQSILFIEFDGPRSRQVWARTMAEPNDP